MKHQIIIVTARELRRMNKVLRNKKYKVIKESVLTLISFILLVSAVICYIRMIGAV